jgi:hypothetical protein
MSYGLDDFTGYINNRAWKNAKTYEHFAPHAYVLSFPCEKLKNDNKCSGDCVTCKSERQAFENAVMFIREHGERAQFMKRIYTMFCLDDYQYWTMGEPLETTWVLNKAIINDPRCKVKTYWLDRD